MGYALPANQTGSATHSRKITADRFHEQAYRIVYAAVRVY